MKVRCSRVLCHSSRLSLNSLTLFLVFEVMEVVHAIIEIIVIQTSHAAFVIIFVKVLIVIYSNDITASRR